MHDVIVVVAGWWLPCRSFDRLPLGQAGALGAGHREGVFTPLQAL